MEIWQACLAETQQIGFFLFFALLHSERGPEQEEAEGWKSLATRESLWNSLGRENSAVGVPLSVVLSAAGRTI